MKVPHNMIILYFHLPYFNVSNSVLFFILFYFFLHSTPGIVLVLSFYIDVVWKLSTDINIALHGINIPSIGWLSLDSNLAPKCKSPDNMFPRYRRNRVCLLRTVSISVSLVLLVGSSKPRLSPVTAVVNSWRYSLWGFHWNDVRQSDSSYLSNFCTFLCIQEM